MKPRMIHVAEPRLEFRYGQKVEYPRDGLYLFGPVDAGQAPRNVRYGVIGTPDGLRRFKEWAEQVSGYIDGARSWPNVQGDRGPPCRLSWFQRSIFLRTGRPSPRELSPKSMRGDLRRRMNICQPSRSHQGRCGCFCGTTSSVARKRDEDPPELLVRRNSRVHI
jgi:hypothetical protein